MFWVQDPDGNPVCVVDTLVTQEPPYSAVFLVYENGWQWLPADKYRPPPAPNWQPPKKNPCGCDVKSIETTTGAIAREGKQRFMCPDCGTEWQV